MSETETAVKTLETILGHLGFEIAVEVIEGEENTTLQVESAHSDAIIGRYGERLDDLQYLVNRIVQKEHPEAPRFKVDCNHYREQTEDELKQDVLEQAARVKETGEPYTMRPLNGYYRRIVHHVLADDDEIETASPQSDDRLKRMTLSKKS